MEEKQMPLITVWNSGIEERRKRGMFAVSLRGAALKLGALGGLLKGNQVTVCFAGDDPSPVDIGEEDPPCPCIIVVEMLFDSTEWTAEICRTLAKFLGEEAKKFYQERFGVDREIEVVVRRFNPQRVAFWNG